MRCLFRLMKSTSGSIRFGIWSEKKRLSAFCLRTIFSSLRSFSKDSNSFRDDCFRTRYAECSSMAQSAHFSASFSNRNGECPSIPSRGSDPFSDSIPVFSSSSADTNSSSRSCRFLPNDENTG